MYVRRKAGVSTVNQEERRNVNGVNQACPISECESLKILIPIRLILVGVYGEAGGKTAVETFNLTIRLGVIRCREYFIHL